MLKIRLVRNQYESAAGYTHGRLLLDECGFFCWTLEPEDRGLTQDMSEAQIRRIKVVGQTAIPKGTYLVKMRVSPSLKDREYASRYGGMFPYIENVPGFSSVLFHPGNTKQDTRACVLPGMLHSGIRGHIFDSVKTYKDLMDFYLWPAHLRGDEIWLTVE